MLDEDKISRLKRLGSFCLIGLVLLFSYGLGVASQTSKVKELSKQETTKKNKKTENVLNQSVVKDFLLAYYTKKDLGENRRRYQPFMTDSLYQEQVAFEDEAVNLAYKGYVVDYQFKEATIYIDQVNQVALATVRYTNTLLTEKNKVESRQMTVSNEVTLKLSYQSQGNRMILDQMETMVLAKEGTTGVPSYGTVSRPVINEDSSNDGTNGGESDTGESSIPESSETTVTETEKVGGN